jgi:hypothetical protein
VAVLSFCLSEISKVQLIGSGSLKGISVRLIVIYAGCFSVDASRRYCAWYAPTPLNVGGLEIGIGLRCFWAILGLIFSGRAGLTLSCYSRAHRSLIFSICKVASITWPTAGCGWQPPPLARIVEGTNCRVRTVSLWGAMPIPGAGASKISSEPRGISGGEGRSSDGDGMDSRISKATLKSSQVPLPNSCTV